MMTPTDLPSPSQPQPTYEHPATGARVTVLPRLITVDEVRYAVEADGLVLYYHGGAEVKDVDVAHRVRRAAGIVLRLILPGKVWA